jgi:L-fuconolactonase
VKKGEATADTFFPKLVAAFSSKRMAWGSNYPTSEGTLIANLEKAKAGLKSLSAEDQEWIFGKTAQTLYPRLAD